MLPLTLSLHGPLVFPRAVGPPLTAPHVSPQRGPFSFGHRALVNSKSRHHDFFSRGNPGKCPPDANANGPPLTNAVTQH